MISKHQFAINRIYRKIQYLKQSNNRKEILDPVASLLDVKFSLAFIHKKMQLN